MSVAIPRLVLQVRYNYTGRLNEGLKFKERNGSAELVCSRTIWQKKKTCLTINRDVKIVDFTTYGELANRLYVETPKCSAN